MKNLIRNIIIYLLLPLYSLAQPSEWEWAAAGSGPQQERGYDIVSDNYGNVYVVGTFEASFTLGSEFCQSQGTGDIFIAKFNAQGETVWVRSEGGTDLDEGFSIAIDGNNEVYISGSFSGTISLGNTSYTAEGGSDILLMKYDSAGNIIWTRTWGGLNNDEGISVAVNSDRLYLTGDFCGVVDFDVTTLQCVGNRNVFTMKLDTTGTVTWVKRAGGTGFDYAADINVMADGPTITGTSNSYTMYFGIQALPDVQMFIAHYNDTTGNIIWAKGAKGMNTEQLHGSAVGTDANGSVYVVGYCSNAQNINFGSTILSDAAGYVAKYNASGTLLWVKDIADYGRVFLRSVALDSWGNVFVAGYQRGLAVYNSDTVFNNMNNEVLVAKLDSDGEVLWTAVAGGSGSDEAYSIALGNNSSIFSTGYFSSSGCDAVFGYITLGCGGGQDMYTAALSQTTGLPEIRSGKKNLLVYPSPAHEVIYVRELNGTIKYKITSITGAEITHGQLDNQNNSINIQGLLPGLYLLHIGSEVHKLVKE